MSCSSWNEQMELRLEESLKNSCREMVEVTGGLEWQIRRLQAQFPEYVWKFTEGVTLPGYVLEIAKQLEREFENSDSIPTDLYPCEYFRIMEHSMPTEIALQPKRFDKVKKLLSEKMQKYYEAKEDELHLPDEQLIAKIACAARVNDKWHRARLENAPNQWLYVYLVDEGVSRQIAKSDIRRLPVRFGHYPPMVVKAKVRGAHIQRMDMHKIDMFRDVMEEFEYLTRCQVISSNEPYEVNICHPLHDGFQNMCPFLLAPVRGEPGVDGVWIPEKLARELKKERGGGYSDSDFDEDASDVEQEEWNDPDRDSFLRSLPPAQKAFRVFDSDFQIERIENEHRIYLTNERMRQNREEIEKMLNEGSNEPLPEEWRVFGAVCSILVDKIFKRAVIYGVHGDELDLLLVDYGVTMKSSASEVRSIANQPILCSEPTVTLVSLADFDGIHFSRIQILRDLLPRGTAVKFVRNGKSKEIPTKGSLIMNETPVTDLVVDEINRRHLNIQSRELVLFDSNYINNNNPVTDNNFLYNCLSSVIYKKSKLVVSPY